MTMPFAGGIDANANATLIFSLVAAVIYAFTLGMPPSLARSAAKTLAMAMLAVLAALQGGPLLLVAALALSAVGDAFLSRDGEKAFLGGLASFLVAHIVYIALFLRSGGGVGLLGAESWRGAIALALAVFVVVMLAALWRRVGPSLRIPIAVYVVAILAMGMSALTTNSAWSSVARCCSWLRTGCSPRRNSWSRPSRRIAAGCVWLSGFCTTLPSSRLRWVSCWGRAPARFGQFEGGEIKTRCDGAADQGPFAEAARRLPPARRYDDLRPLARRELDAEHLLDHGTFFFPHR